MMKTKIKVMYWCIYILMLCTIQTHAQIKAIQENISTVDKNALTISGRFASAINGRTFQKDIIISHNGFQYLAYYDAERHVCLARRKLPKGTWEIIRFLDYDFESNDAHNVISMGICPNDGTIHLAFDHHGHELNYRVSKKDVANAPESINWEANAFGPVICELEKGKPIKITYPKFWQTPEGNLQFNYRQGGSGNGDRMMVDYNSDKGIWENTRQIDSRSGFFKDELGESHSRCSYPNGYDYDSKGRLHTTWVWREDSQGSNHDLMYALSEDEGFSWKNSFGKPLSEIPNVNSEGITVQIIPRVLGLANDHGQTIDSKDRIHVVMYHCSEETIKKAGGTLGKTKWGPDIARRYHHYWRGASGEWNHYEMDWVSGDRPKIFADKNDNLIMIFRERPLPHEYNSPNENEKKNLKIAVASAQNNWKDWQIVYSLKGPFINEMLGDFYRWKSDGVLSIVLQDSPEGVHQPSKLKVVDFTFNSPNNAEQ